MPRSSFHVRDIAKRKAMPTPITSPSSQIAECVKRKQEYQELLDKRDAKKQRPRESSQLAAEPDANPGAAFLEAHPEPTATTPRTEPYCKPQRNTIRCYPLVWELDNHRAPAHLQAYSERAARWQSSLVVDKMPTLAELRRSVVDGHVLLGRRGRFVQMSMSCSEWHSTNYWRSFAEKFEVEETDASCSLLTSDTSLGPHKIGSGSYALWPLLRPAPSHARSRVMPSSSGRLATRTGTTSSSRCAAGRCRASLARTCACGLHAPIPGRTAASGFRA